MSRIYEKIMELKKVDIVEFIMVLEDIKPCMFDMINKSDKLELEKICKNLGLFINFEAMSPDDKNEFVNNRDNIWFTISKDNNISESVLELKNNHWSPEFARQLGYPSCCNDFFVKLSRDKELKNLIHHIHKNTKSKPNLYVNNVFNYTSRLQGKTDRLLRLHLLNKEMHLPFYKFIAHAPCSYNCQKSIVMGEKTHSAIKKHRPELAKEIYAHLSKPILFFDDFRWVLFNGHARGNSVLYESINKPHSFITKEPVYQKLLSGNRIDILDDRIEISKNNKKIGKVKKKSESEGFILNFTDQGDEKSALS